MYPHIGFNKKAFFLPTKFNSLKDQMFFNHNCSIFLTNWNNWIKLCSVLSYMHRIIKTTSTLKNAIWSFYFFFCLILKRNTKFVYKKFHVSKKRNEKKRKFCDFYKLSKILTKVSHRIIILNLSHEKFVQQIIFLS